MAMSTIASLACSILNATPENCASLTEAVLDYVRANNKGDASLFVSVKGKGGGTSRRSDLPAAV